jgi:hypothetical protein
VPDPAPASDWPTLGTAALAAAAVVAAVGGAIRGARDIRGALRAWLIADLARDVRALTLRADAQDRALMELAHADPRPAADRVARELRELRRAVHALARDPDATDPDADGAR